MSINIIKVLYNPHFLLFRCPFQINKLRKIYICLIAAFEALITEVKQSTLRESLIVHIK